MDHSGQTQNRVRMQAGQARDISYTLRRYYVDRFHERVFCDQDMCGQLILDLGGNKKAKRGQFDIECYDNAVIYANLSAVKSPDTVADAGFLPFASGTFDSVICSELLEHVYDPRRVLGEVSRVLRRGGRLIVCAPFMIGIHGDPHDYGRYTDSYWKTILPEFGFEDIDIEFHGSFFSVFFDMLRSVVYESISHWGPERRISIALIGRVLGIMKTKAVAMDEKAMKRISPKSPSVTTGFGIKATKK